MRFENAGMRFENVCLALKKVDTKVNKNEYKRSTDKEWQEKDKPRSQNGDSAGILSRGAAQPKCAGKEIWDRDGDGYRLTLTVTLTYVRRINVILCL